MCLFKIKCTKCKQIINNTLAELCLLAELYYVYTFEIEDKTEYNILAL